MRSFRIRLAACLVWSLASAARAQTYTPMATATPNTVPGSVHYQGRLEDNGFPAQGNRTMRFKLYDAAAAGTLLWDSGDQTVNISIGIFGVDLSIPLAALQGSARKYLEVTVQGTTLAPREALATVPYALIAKTVEGTLDISNGGLSISSAPTSTKPSLFVSSGNANVGLNTNTPATLLHMSSGTLTIDGNTVPSIVAKSSVTVGGTGTPRVHLDVPGGTIQASTLKGDNTLQLTSGSGASSVILQVNGTEGARLDSSGQFKAGASASQSAFTTTGSLDMFSGSTIAANGTLTFSTATVAGTGNPALLIDKNANVVIGSTGTFGGLARMLTLSSVGAGDAVGLELIGNKTAAQNTPASVNFLNIQASQASKYIARVAGGVGRGADPDSGNLFFTTADNAGTLGTRMTIDESGQVGIGTTAPATLLEVNGAAQFGSGATKSTFTATGGLRFDAAYSPSANTEAATVQYVNNQVVNGGGWSRTGTSVFTSNSADSVTVRAGTLTVQGSAFSVAGTGLAVDSIGVYSTLPLTLSGSTLSVTGANGIGLSASDTTATLRRDSSYNGVVDGGNFRTLGQQTLLADGQGAAAFYINATNSFALTRDATTGRYDLGLGGANAMTFDTGQRVGVGNVAPTSKLHVSSGIVTIDGVNGGLRVSSGSLTGVLISGWLSATAAFNPGTVGAGVCVESGAITVTGALDGNECYVGVPAANASITGAHHSCYVSAASTVKIRSCCTNGATTCALTNQTYRVTTFLH
ncbi:MAG: hypothetical protein HY925_12820 [Elusimicrobia bacterium]|nr:hypothetical protein [Elusimicrobiota bacterium]